MLPNPGEKFYISLASKVVREVNAMKDGDGMSYTRKAMIRTSNSLNRNGKWEESQLLDELKEIVAKK